MFTNTDRTAAFEQLEGRTLFAVPTDLDPSFSGDGKLITDFGGANDVARAVAVQSDGRIVVAGETQVTVNGIKKTAFAAVRYNPDGSLDDGGSKDTTKGDKFGTGGKFVRVLDQGGGSGALSIAIQKDGKIILGGNAIKSASTGSQWYFLRLNKDGSLDSGFGSAGIQSTKFAATLNPAFRAMTLQQDGRLLVAGGVEGDWVMQRLTTSGQFDKSFGPNGNGIVSADFGGNVFATAITLDSIGRIVVAGQSKGPAGEPQVGLARFSASGERDMAFGTLGRTIYKTSAVSADVNNVVVLPNGDINIGVGFRYKGNNGKIITSGAGLRFTAAGVSTGNFENFGFTAIIGIGHLPNGSFTTGGTSARSGADKFAFGVDGVFKEIAFGSNTDANVANAFVIAPDGKVVQVGTTTAGGGGKNFAIARYAGTPTKSLGLITGNVFNDLDQDGVRDSNEPGLGNMAVYIDANNDGDPEGDRMVRTDSNGNYSFYVKPATHIIREVNGMLVLSRPVNVTGSYIVNATAGRTFGGIDFGNFKFVPPTTGTRIVGSVYFDFNGNDFRNEQNPTEPDLPGRTVFLDLNDNSVMDANEPRTATDGGGNFAFDNLTPGLYKVGDILPSGWTHTNPNGKFYIFNLGANQTRSVKFGTTFADDDDTIDEVNNKPGNQIGVGGSVNFTISNVTDVDLVRFTAKKGQRIGFDVDRAGGSSLNSFLRLFDANGNQLAVNDDAAGPGESKGADSYLEYTFSAAGNYFIGVSNSANTKYEPRFGYDDNGAGTTGGYKMTLVGIAPGTSFALFSAQKISSSINQCDADQEDIVW